MIHIGSPLAKEGGKMIVFEDVGLKQNLSASDT